MTTFIAAIVASAIFLGPPMPDPLNFPHHAVFSPDARTVLTTGTEASALWEARTGADLGSLGANGGDAVFTPDGSRVVFFPMNGHEPALVDVRSRSPRYRFGGAAAASRATFSRDGRRVLLSGSKGYATIYDVASGAVLVALGSLEGYVDAELASDGQRVVTLSKGAARVWDATTGAPLFALAVRDASDVALSPDGALIVTIAGGRTTRAVEIWSALTGDRLGVIAPPSIAAPLLPKTFHPTVAFSADARRLLVTGWGKHDRSATIHALPRGNVVAVLADSSGPVVAGAFSPDGALVATGADDGTAAIWSAAAGTRVAVLEVAAGSHVRVVSFSSDGQTVLTLGWGRWPARLWDRTGALLKTLGPPELRP